MGKDVVYSRVPRTELPFQQVAQYLTGVFLTLRGLNLLITIMQLIVNYRIIRYLYHKSIYHIKLISKRYDFRARKHYLGV